TPPCAEPGRYVELHCHSSFSLREGASRPEELVLWAKALGYTALAVTDHDSLAGAMQFAKSATAWGIQPIIGAEVTVVGGTGNEEQGTGSGSAQQRLRRHAAGGQAEAHLTLLCGTRRGCANRRRVLTRARRGSPRGEPRVRFDWLAEHAEGLIALS